MSKIINKQTCTEIVHGIHNNWLPKNKGNWLTDKPDFMLTCDTVSGSLEGCPDIKIYHQTGDLKN